MKDLTNTTPTLKTQGYPIDSYIKSKKNQGNNEKTINNNKEVLEKYDFTLNSDKLGNIEYTKRVVNALKEVIKENEDLKHKMKDVIYENLELRKEIKENYKAIDELGRFYYYCIQNHSQSVDEDENEKEDEEKKEEEDEKEKEESNDIITVKNKSK